MRMRVSDIDSYKYYMEHEEKTYEEFAVGVHLIRECGGFIRLFGLSLIHISEPTRPY